MYSRCISKYMAKYGYLGSLFPYFLPFLQITLLDGKRSLNLNIFLKQFKAPNDVIVGNISKGDVEKFGGAERLKGLLKLMPEKQEVSTWLLVVLSKVGIEGGRWYGVGALTVSVHMSMFQCDCELRVVLEGRCVQNGRWNGGGGGGHSLYHFHMDMFQCNAM